MKRWILVTLLLYLLCITVLVVPLFLFVSPEGGKEMLQAFYIWVVPVLVLAQAGLLVIPTAVVKERPVKRREVAFSALMGAVPMAILLLGFLGSLILMIWEEKGVGDLLYGSIFIVLGVSWIIWAVVFYGSFLNKERESVTSSLTKWLLRGSILELIVAVPSHIISRHREECCAPPFTLFGIAAGLSIALMAFGPGIFFLFARKIKDKQGKTL